MLRNFGTCVFRYVKRTCLGLFKLFRKVFSHKMRPRCLFWPNIVVEGLALSLHIQEFVSSDHGKYSVTLNEGFRDNRMYAFNSLK
jgi:hypothetical protein